MNQTTHHPDLENLITRFEALIDRLEQYSEAMDLLVLDQQRLVDQLEANQ